MIFIYLFNQYTALQANPIRKQVGKNMYQIMNYK